MVIKFDFNCILINKDGVHPIDLAATDPLAGVKQSQTEAPAATATGQVPIAA